jgi:death-on-curing protein
VTTPEVEEEPKWITESVLLAIHAQQVERYGGLHGVRDKNVVLSAPAWPEHRRAHDKSADLADLAAAYLVGFARTQGFNDGNKRSALACALVFLSINGVELHVPPAELLALTMAVANEKDDEANVAAYFRNHLAT